VPRPPFPKTLREFQAKFASEEACRKYLVACRWPDGFACPRCGNRRAYELVKAQRWQCTGCRHQVALTAGTILRNRKTPLAVWFWAAYLMTTDKRGISALLLQRQLGLRRYETAWMMLHKFRRAMINKSREPLRGEVEVDETWVGGTQAGLQGSRQLKGRKAALVLVVVEKRGCKKPDSNMLLAANRYEPTCGKVRSPLCLWQTAPLVTSSSGCSEPTTG
jgi:transposase-like protein